MKWVKIAGYGELGDSNWGFDHSKVEAQKWFEECSKHIGETVLLTGGGTLGGYDYGWTATLVRVVMGRWGERDVPKVFLTCLSSPVIGNSVEFNPFLGSWQISVMED